MKFTKESIEQFLQIQEQVIEEAEHLGEIYADVYRQTGTRRLPEIRFESIDENIELAYYKCGQYNAIYLPLELIWSDDPRRDMLANKEKQERQTAEKKRLEAKRCLNEFENSERENYARLKEKYG